MQKEAGFAEVNGTRLYYEVAGSGDPLVLIHGMTLDTRMWDDQFEPLAHQYRVVRYDARGFGKSALPAVGKPYAHTDDLKALLRHLDIARAFILGLSMGGGIALDFAVAHPEATEALIPVDSRLNGWQPDAEFASYLSAVRARAKEAGVQAARDAWIYGAMFKPALEHPTVASRLVQIIGMALGQRQSAPHIRPVRRTAAPYHSGAYAHRHWRARCSGLPSYRGNLTSAHTQCAQGGDDARGAHVKHGGGGTIQCARIGLPSGTTTHALTSGWSGPARRRPLRRALERTERHWLTMADTDKIFAGSIPKLYETHLVPLIFEPYAADLRERIKSRRIARLLEVAAGTGVVTRVLATVLDPSASIVATDLNQAMLDEAATVGTSRPVDWRQADAMALPFRDGEFDTIVCQFGAMFFPDKTKAFAEARRVLQPGGIFIFSVWDRISENEFADSVTTALESVFPKDPPRFLARTPHGYHDRRTIERDLEVAGFQRPPQIVTVAARSRAQSARIPAIAYCQGTPLRSEIAARDASGLTEATDVAAKAIAQRFGTGPVDGKIQAHIVIVDA